MNARPLRCWFASLAIAASLLGCQTAPPAPVSDLSDRPAEKSLVTGIRAYEDGQYAIAEKELNNALALTLAAPLDAANAHKYLAFIYCTSNRWNECEKAFLSARAADPNFALSKAEAGHPQWGPVYRRTLNDASKTTAPKQQRRD